MAPAFSWTAHTAQGQTLKAAIVDMQIGAGTSPMASYVSFTRVKKMQDLLIFRPFDRELFNQGNLEGPLLLLKVLRGEVVDWEAVEAKHLPSNICNACGNKMFKTEFSEAQWKHTGGKRLCINCEGNLSHNGLKKECSWCGSWQPKAHFDPKLWRQRNLPSMLCKDCGEKRQCRGEYCENSMKNDWEFSKIEWKEAAKPYRDGARGRCIECLQKQQDLKDLRLCSGCKQNLPQHMHF